MKTPRGVPRMSDDEKLSVCNEEDARTSYMTKFCLSTQYEGINVMHHEPSA